MIPVHKFLSTLARCSIPHCWSHTMASALGELIFSLLDLIDHKDYWDVNQTE